MNSVDFTVGGSVKETLAELKEQLSEEVWNSPCGYDKIYLWLAVGDDGDGDYEFEEEIPMWFKKCTVGQALTKIVKFYSLFSGRLGDHIYYEGIHTETVNGETIHRISFGS